MNNKNNTTPIDLEDVLERVQDDWELLFELFEIFEQDFGVKRTQLAQMVAQKDFSKVRDLAHSLKGASGNISAKPLFQSFYQLEKMGENKEPSRMEETLKVIDGQFQEFIACVGKIKKDYETR